MMSLFKKTHGGWTAVPTWNFAVVESLKSAIPMHGREVKVKSIFAQNIPINLSSNENTRQQYNSRTYWLFCLWACTTTRWARRPVRRSAPPVSLTNSLFRSFPRCQNPGCVYPLPACKSCLDPATTRGELHARRPIVRDWTINKRTTDNELL